MRLKETEQLYVRSMGKLLRVTAIFDTDLQANAYMAVNDEGVVAVFERKNRRPVILLANLHDKGIKI